MKKYNQIFFFLLICWCCPQNVFSQTQQWVVRYNGNANVDDESRLLYVDASGNSYFGSFAKTTAGAVEYALAKYDASGNQLWVVLTGDAGLDDWINAMTVDGSGNVYVTGYFSTEKMTTIKYNSSGVQQWISQYTNGSTYDAGTSITINASYVYVTGYSSASAFPNRFDFVTIKYDIATGATQAGWPVRYNGPGNDEDNPKSIAVDGSGNVYIAGYTYNGATNQKDYVTVSYDASGTMRTGWPKLYNSPANGDDIAMQLTLSGVNIIVTGYSAATAGFYTDIVTIMYDASGNVVAGWPQRYNGSGNDEDAMGSDVVFNGPQFNATNRIMITDASGNVYINCYTWSSATQYDMLTLKYNSSGTLQWAVTYNGAGNNSDLGYGIALDGSGNVFVTGLTYNAAGTSDDMVTVKYNASGTQQWATTYNGPGNGFDEAYAVSVVSSNIWITGRSAGSGTGYDLTTIKYSDAVLPVELLSFSGKMLADNSVFLNWLTASEQNNNYFTIEKSLDGREFISVGTVTGSGNSSTTLCYKFIDKIETSNPKPETIYYRLKQTDYDGKFTYSQIISVQSGEIFSVFVNQHANTAEFTCILNQSEKVSLKIFDVLGKEIFSENISSEKGLNAVSVPLTNFRNGLYIASFTSSFKTTNKKFVIDL